MQKVRAYIKGFITISALLIAAITAVPAFAGHAQDLHETKFYGAPGDEFIGQVTVMNPGEETKVIKVAVENHSGDHLNWLILDKDEYTVGAKGKAVISYKVIIPAQAEKDSTHTINIREIAPKNTLSVTQTVSISLLKPTAQTEGATEINIFYTTFFIMIIVSFGIGLAFCAVICVKKIPHLWEANHKKRAGKRGK